MKCAFLISTEDYKILTDILLSVKGYPKKDNDEPSAEIEDIKLRLLEIFAKYLDLQRYGVGYTG